MAGVEALLLAAGESTRMGRPKALLPWHGATLVEYQVRALAAAGVSRIVVVLGHNPVEVAPAVRGADGLRMLINPDYAKGKTTSIKAGLREVGRGTLGVLLLAVDQPRPVGLLRRLLQEHLEAGALVTQPVYQARGGHPVLFSPSLLPELLAITEEQQGIREVLERHRAQVQRVQVDSPMVLLDLNTEEQYQQALRMLQTEGAQMGGGGS